MRAVLNFYRINVNVAKRTFAISFIEGRELIISPKCPECKKEITSFSFIASLMEVLLLLMLHAAVRYSPESSSASSPASSSISFMDPKVAKLVLDLNFFELPII